MTTRKTNQRLSRRELLGLMGAAGAAMLVACSDDDKPAASATSTPAATSPAAAATSTPAPGALSCVLTPEQTDGPYFVDEQLNRADIRSDPTDGSTKEGVPLRMPLTVYRVDGADCTPLAGAIVDIWQCDAVGVYSDVTDANGFFDTKGQKFLRGYQVTDANGAVEFTTVYPGWYQGRTIHIHVKVRSEPDARQGYELTTQFYFDEAVTAQVLAQAPYNTKTGTRETTNDNDGIFQQGGSQLMLALTPEGQGYAGTFSLGLQMS